MTFCISRVAGFAYLAPVPQNSANIIVQNRMTGQLEEEKMQVYVRLGIRLLYKASIAPRSSSVARRRIETAS